MSNPANSPPPDRLPEQSTLPLGGGSVLLPAGHHPPGSPGQRQPVALAASTPNAVGLLKALRRRWLLALTLGILAAGATAAAVWVFLPPGKHTAYMKLYMPKKPEGVLYAHPEDVGEFGAFQQTQLALMKSRTVLNAALSNPKVKDLNLAAVKRSLSPVEWLEREVRVSFPEGVEIPRLSMTGDNPEQLKVLLKAVVDAYFREVVEHQSKRRQNRLDQLKEVAATYQKRLERITAARNEVAKTLGSPDQQVIAFRQQMTQKQLALAQAELLKVDADLRRMELEAKTYKATGNDAVEIPDKVVDTYIDKELGKEMAYRAKLEADLADVRRVMDGDEREPVQKVLRAIEIHNKTIEARRKELRPRYKAELLERAQQDSQGSLGQVQDKVRFYKEFRTLLDKEITRLNAEARNDNVRALDLDGYRIDMLLGEAGVTRVLTEIDKLTVELPDPPRVSHLPGEEVVVVAPDEVARKFQMAGMGGVGAFGVVLLLIALVEFRSRRLDNFDEVAKGLGLQLMGTLPAAPSRMGRGLMRSGAASTAQWQSLLAESVNSVRTLLLRASRSEPLRVLMVTSAMSGEGKTSLATHLAASLARAGHKTLLLDGDLRKPAAHRVLDLPLTPGFSETLRGEVEPSGAIRPTLVDGLSLLAAGQCDSEALERLARGGVHGLLERLKQDYDFIVIDSSPVLPVADSLLLAQYADGVLFSLFHEVSRLPLVYLAHQKLNLVGARMLGAVINGTHDNSYGYGQYNTTVVAS